VSKYEGIQKPNAELKTADTVRSGRKKKAGGFWRLALYRLIIAAVIVGVLFGIGAIDTPFTNAITDTIRNVFSANFSFGGSVVSRDYYWLNNLIGNP